MPSTWTIGQKIGGGFGLAVLSLLWVGLVASDRLESLLNDASGVSHSFRILGALSQAQYDLGAAESNAQGYAATGQPHFLTGFQAQVAQLQQDRKELRHLLRSNPVQLERFTQLEVLTTQRLELLKRAIATRQKGKLAAASRLAGPEQSRELMRKLERLVAELQSEEKALLRGRQEGAERAARSTQLTILSVLGASLLLVAAIGGLIVRGLGRSLEPLVEAARRVGLGDLSARIPVSGHDEIAELATAFNDMSDQLQRERQTTQQEILTSHASLEEMVHSLQQRSQDADLLRRLLELIESSQDKQEAFRSVGPFFLRLFPETAGSVMLISPSKNVVETLTCWGWNAAEEMFTPPNCWSLRRGCTHFARQGDPEPFCAHVDDEGSSWTLCVPMMAQGEALGILHLRPISDQPLAQKTMQLAESVAEQLSLAIANLVLRETLRQQSVRDTLTGLYNRRFMEESLEREVFRARRKRESVSVIMLDVDHFKRFNDQFGHDAGDAVLQAVGRFLRENVRAEDVACRYGGEEFILILPGSSLQNGAARAEALREGISRLEVSVGRQSLSPISISVGVSSYPTHGQACTALIKAADTALYQAKLKGRNRVVLAPTPEISVASFRNPESVA